MPNGNFKPMDVQVHKSPIPHLHIKSIWRRARRIWRSRLINVDEVGGGGQGIKCRRFFALDVVPVQLTIYSLSKLITKMSGLYPSSYFV